MVPLTSRRVSRVPRYSGSCQLLVLFAYMTITFSGEFSHTLQLKTCNAFCSPKPRSARTPVWALTISLAATFAIEFSFFSSGYLDVSVHRVPSVWLWIHHTVHEVFSCGFPHSDISGSQPICGSPKLFAAYHVFHRLSVPRHPPCALFSLT